MKKYALKVEDPISRVDVTLYIEKEEGLHEGKEVIVKRGEVKSWEKDIRGINKLFLKRGIKKGKNLNDYEVKLKVGSEAGGYRCLKNDPTNSTYQGFNASLV